MSGHKIHYIWCWAISQNLLAVAVSSEKTYVVERCRNCAHFVALDTLVNKTDLEINDCAVIGHNLLASTLSLSLVVMAPAMRYKIEERIN
jgi:hypothetical protein